jgi:hypothetical protein
MFTDVALADPEVVFDCIKRFLRPAEVSTQLKLSVMDDFRNYKI